MNKIILMTFCGIIIMFFATACIVTITSYAGYIQKQIHTDSLYLSKTTCAVYGNDKYMIDTCTNLSTKLLDYDGVILK